MQFGLATTQAYTTWEALDARVAAADESDMWESAWVGDHFYPFLDDSAGPCLEGWITLTALAARTRRIGLGILVSGMPHRHPAVLAKMAATLDIVCNGRLRLGLGAAWNALELDAYGIDLGSVRTRLDRLEEGIEVVARLLRDETTTFAGEHYRLAEARCSPKPIQRPHPPITVGGTGEQRTARIAARWADHWDLGFTPADQVPQKRAALAGHCEAIDRDPNEITISVVVRTVDNHGERSLDQLATTVDGYERAGVDLVLIEALPADPRDAPIELERLTAACHSRQRCPSAIKSAAGSPCSTRHA
jgi:F420-dependent oxidoreductase-like protein